MLEIQISVSREGNQVMALIRTADEKFPASQPLPNFSHKAASRLRWVLEDQPRLSDEAVKSAGVLQSARLMQFGNSLFEVLRDPLTKAMGNYSLNEVSLSIDDPNGVTREWPWELLNSGQAPFVFDCRSFVRKLSQQPSRLAIAQRTSPLRVLIVVARPKGTGDVAFRSVASRVMEATTEQSMQIELLRPPTFDALQERLLSAQENGQPYDIVHFDGHGVLVEAGVQHKGVLLFEDEADYAHNMVDGHQLGELLLSANVPLLILNACHSGAAPLSAPAESNNGQEVSIASASLAECVGLCGPIDVVAMSHAVYVSTAALVIGDLYRCLDQGRNVGEAVSFARRRWSGGIVGSSTEIGFCILRHFGCPADTSELSEWPSYVEPNRLDDRTPHHPKMQAEFHADGYFVGSDDPILLLEQALRRNPIVQLNGLRGAGKSTLMLELGRWLAASSATDPTKIVYLDLSSIDSPTDATGRLMAIETGTLMIDHAECLHGDVLRNVTAWPGERVRVFVERLFAMASNGIQVLIACDGRIAELGDVERLVLPRLDVEDVRALIALHTDQEIACQTPEPAILWTAGQPAMVPIIEKLHAAGALSDANNTLQALSELHQGRFTETKPPMEQILRLQLPNSGALFQPDVGLPWLLMQFQGQAILLPLLWELASNTGLSSMAEGESLDRVLGHLERAGLVAPLNDDGLMIHPLLPCLIAHPFNERQLCTEGYMQSLARVQGLFAQYMQVLAQLPYSGDMRPAGHAYGWDLQNLLHAYTNLTSDLQISHTGALSLARRLRERFFEMSLPDYWIGVLQRLQENFANTQPPPDDGQFNPNSELNLLLMEEANRTGDQARAAEFARKGREFAEQLPGPGGDAPQTNAYDVQLKIGRQSADSDAKGARKALEAALKLADQDPLRQAIVQFELCRVLRNLDPPFNLSSARVHGESALSIFQKLVKVKICSSRRIVLTTMSLSLVYRDLLKTPQADPSWATRGESLCRESLRLAQELEHKATAWFNLGDWRRRAGDFKSAGSHYLEASSLYEELDAPINLAYALTYRAQCLLECKDYLQSRLDAVRAATLIFDHPSASRQMLLLAYNTGKEAWAKFNSTETAAD